MRFELKKVFFIVLLGVSMILAKPLYEDSEVAASGGDHHGRVQIKVYRGPTDHDGHDSFAPYGYWVKQPADDEH